MVKQRQSNIELLRCMAIFFVIIYHIFIFALNPIHPETKLYQALQIPLHVGVPLFVMISGYFGIRFSLSGLMRLWSKGFIYIVPLTVIPAILASTPIKDVIWQFFLFGNNTLWYLNAYLYLFLFSPVINKYLDSITLSKRFYLLTILCFMSIYIGNVTEGDIYLVEGKNLTNFLLLYVIGNTIRSYQEQIHKLSQIKLVTSYIIFNVLLTMAFMFVPLIAGKIWKYSFAYNSPIILINCVWIFLIFSKLSFKSTVVNYAGSSIYACYLIQCPEIIWKNCFEIPAQQIDRFLASPWLTILTLIGYIMVAMFIMIAMDKLLNPLWNRLIAFASKFDDKWNTKQLR